MDNHENIVAEPSLAYVRLPRVLNLYQVLGLKNDHQDLKSNFDIIELARSGLTKASFISVSKMLSINFEKLADLIDTSVRTIQRKQNNDKLNVLSSSQLVIIAEVFTIVMNALDQNKEMSIKWLTTPYPVFKNKSALDILDTPYGREIVLSEFHKSLHGVI